MLMALAAIRQADGDQEQAMKYIREAHAIAATQPALEGIMSMYGAGQSITAPANPKGAELLVAGKFREALPEYEKACARNPSSHWDWYHIACVHLYLGDDAAYRQAALGMLERFGGSTNAPVGERAAKVCLLTATPVGDMAQLQRLIDKALASQEDASLRPWFAMAKALAQLRAGQHASALEYLDQCRTITSNAGQIAAALIRAMALQGMGERDKAKEEFTRAAARVDNELPKAGAAPLNSPENWMICHILRRQADQLINGKSSKE
jgi:hypothetical protein